MKYIYIYISVRYRVIGGSSSVSKIPQGCLIPRSSPSIIAASLAFTRLHPRVRSSLHERDSSLTESPAFMHNVVAVVVASSCSRLHAYSKEEIESRFLNGNCYIIN